MAQDRMACRSARLSGLGRTPKDCLSEWSVQHDEMKRAYPSLFGKTVHEILLGRFLAVCKPNYAPAV
jgi:hypothetical protein